MSNSPFILVHGIFGWGESEGANKFFPYWGTTTGDSLKYLRQQGHEVYSASVAPLSGVWYTACELYAQLTGTTVDYGEYHSSLCGQRRFGRTYEKPVFEDWSENKKIHIIGHSFGAATVRMFAHILTHGAPEEVSCSGKENVSPFFLGGHENLLASVTSICGSLNPTKTFGVAQKYKLLSLIKNTLMYGAAILSRTPLDGKIVDVRFERIGMNNTPGKKDRYPLRKVFEIEKKDIDAVYKNLSPEGLQRLNDIIDISPNTPFISYPFNFVKQKKNSKLITFDTYFPLLYAITSLIFFDGHISGRGTDKIHDGLLEIESAEHPDDEPFTRYNPEKGLQKGMWNIMPLTFADHGMPIGLFGSKKETRDFLNNVFNFLEKEERRAKKAEKSTQ
ncbi:MAG: hypothetical protein IJA87_06885 [Clostridia bacterium]|nr:hypothetical protein [Clostridia bacterium]